MKLIILVEDSSDCLAAQQALIGESVSPLVIHCNSGVELGPLPQGWKLKSELDYSEGVDLQALNYTPQQDLQRILNDPEMNVLFSEPPYTLTSLFTYELGRSLGTAYKFTDLLRAIFEKESPDEILVVESPAGTAQRLRFGSHDKFIGRLAPAVVASLKDKYPQLRLRIVKPAVQTAAVLPARAAGKSLKQHFDPALRTSLHAAQKCINAFLRLGSGPRPRIIFKGAPRLMFELMARLKQDGQFSPVYYQPVLAPRLFSTLLRRGVEYKNAESAGEYPSSKWTERKKEFDALLERRRPFCYRGTDLLPMLREKLDYLFATLLSQMAVELRAAERFLQKEKPAVLIVDEENSVSSQCLLLAARTLSIEGMEYQHGAIYHYHLQSRLAEHYLLWGNFFKDKMNRELQIPPEKIRVVGPIHLTPLMKTTGGTDLNPQTLRGKLGAAADAGLILYATHSFNKGSRGGLYNVHMTRREITDLFTCILEAVSKTRGRHLVIKLHHEDHNVSFYKDFVESFGRGICYSVVRDLSIYDLIWACDFMIAPPSTTVLEAILMKKPILLADFDEKRTVFPFGEWGAVSYARSPEEFSRCFHELSVSPQKTVELQAPGREKILNDFVDMAQASSSEAFLTALREIL